MSVWPTAAAFRQSAANGSVGVEAICLYHNE